MATISDIRAVSASLSTTTVDNVRLLQPWDSVEITNHDASTAIYVSDDGATNPTAAGEGFDVVLPGDTKVLKARLLTTATPDGSAVICHELRLIGNGNAYTVAGVAGA